MDADVPPEMDDFADIDLETFARSSHVIKAGLSNTEEAQLDLQANFDINDRTDTSMSSPDMMYFSKGELDLSHGRQGPSNSTMQSTLFKEFQMVLHRMPGEGLGMVLALDGDQDNQRPVSAVLVRSVTPGGAAARVEAGETAIQIGDELRAVDDQSLTSLTHDQCIALLQDMPERTVLTVRRNFRQDTMWQQPQQQPHLVPSVPSLDVLTQEQQQEHLTQASSDMDSDRDTNSCADNLHMFEEDEDNLMRTPRGFVKLQVTVFREDERGSLGLSIVPSHGATCDLYQVKRLLPGGACAESGCLELHDRLLCCNGLSLKGLTQAQCLNVLKSSGRFVELTVLRQIDGGSGASIHQTTNDEDLDQQTLADTQQNFYKGGEYIQDFPKKEFISQFGDSVEPTAAPETPDFFESLAAIDSAAQVTADNVIRDVNSDQFVPQFGEDPDVVDETYTLSQLAEVQNTEASLFYPDTGTSFEAVESVHDRPSEDLEHCEDKSNLSDETDALVEALISASRSQVDVVDSIEEEDRITQDSCTANQFLPPPVQFSDPGNDDNSKELPTCVTNIDDILFDVDRYDDVTYKNQQNSQVQTNLVDTEETFSGDLLEVSTVEEFAEKCFNNIGVDDNYTTFSSLKQESDLINFGSPPTEQETGATDIISSPGATQRELIDSLGPPIGTPSAELHEDLIDISDFVVDPAPVEAQTDFRDIVDQQVDLAPVETQKQLIDFADPAFDSTSEEENRDFIHVVAPSVTQGAISEPQAEENPGLDVEHHVSTIHVYHESPLSHVTNKGVSSINVTHIHPPQADNDLVCLDPEQVSEEIDVDSIGDAPEDIADISPLTLPVKSDVSSFVDETIELQKVTGPDTYLPAGNTDTSPHADLNHFEPEEIPHKKLKLEESVIAGAMSLTTAGMLQDSEEDGNIQPMRAVRDAQGKILAAPKPPLENVDESSDLSESGKSTAKAELASVLNAFHKSKSPSVEATTPPADNKMNGKIVEVEEVIVATKLERGQAQVAFNVLQKWKDESPPKLSTMRQVVGFAMRPENAKAVHTVGVATSGSREEEVIQPMAVVKDHQGKPLCVPVEKESKTDKESPVAAIDEETRKGLESIMVGITSKVLRKDPQPHPASIQNNDVVNEESIVPVLLSKEQSAQNPDLNLRHVLNKEKQNSPKETGIEADLENGACLDDDTRDSKKHEAVSEVKSFGESTLIINIGNQELATISSNENSVSDSDHKFDAGLSLEGEELVRPSTVISVQSSPKQPETEPAVAESAQENSSSPTEKKSEGFLSAVRTFENAAISQPDNLPSKIKVKDLKDVSSVVNQFEQNITESPSDSETVVLRAKPLNPQQSTDFRAKIKTFQSQESPDGISRTTISRSRPRSMIEVSSTSSSQTGNQARVNELRKSFVPTASADGSSKLNPALRPHTQLRPLSIAVSNSSTSSRPLSGNMFSPRSPRMSAQMPRSRQDDGSPFQVDVLKGILGLGFKVKTTPEGQVKVADIQKGGSLDKDKHVRVGDEILSVNSQGLTGQNEARVQQILRLLPRGLVKVVLKADAPGHASITAPDSEPSLRGNNKDGTCASPAVEAMNATLSSTETVIISDAGVERVPSSGEAESKSDGGSQPKLPLTARIEISPASVTAAKPDLSTRIEESTLSTRQNLPVKIDIKPTPTIRQDRTLSKALAPRSPVSPPSSTLGRDVGGAAPGSNPRKITATGSPAFQSHRQMFELKASTVTENEKNSAPPKPHVRSNITISNKLTEKISDSKSEVTVAEESNNHTQNKTENLSIINPKDELDGADTTKSEEEKEVKVEDSATTQKTPPPVAPKPRRPSSSSSSPEQPFTSKATITFGQSESSETVEAPADEVENKGDQEGTSKTKPSKTISAGYERLQALTKSTKPSKIIEKSRQIVTSKARLFDTKSGEDGEENSLAPGRRVSTVSAGSTPCSMNSSLRPLPERRKSTGSSAMSKPLTLAPQFSTEPPTVSHRAAGITLPETSSGDSSGVKSVVSPTRLNNALSPRRTSSIESPTSSPLVFSQIQAPSVKERKSKLESHSQSTNSNAQSGIFKYSPVTSHTSVQSPAKPSPPKAAATVPSPPFTSSVPTPVARSVSVSSTMSEEHLENTMKMFDDLLMDAPPNVRTETDPVDLLLWAPVRTDSSPFASPRKTDESKEKSPETSPRKTDESKEKSPETSPRNQKMTNLESVASNLEKYSENHPVPQKYSENHPVPQKYSENHPVPQPRRKSKDIIDTPAVAESSVATELEVKQADRVHITLSDNQNGSDWNENIIANQISSALIIKSTPESSHNEKDVPNLSDSTCQKQTGDVKTIIIGENTDKIEDNIVAAHVSEAILDKTAKLEKQVLDTQPILKTTMNDESASRNIVANQIFENIMESKSSRQKQSPDVLHILSDESNSEEVNVVAKQISGCLENYLEVADTRPKSEIGNTSKTFDGTHNDTSPSANALDKNMQPGQEFLNDDDAVYRSKAKEIIEDVYTRISDEVFEKSTLENSGETLLSDYTPGSDENNVEEEENEEDEPPPLPGAPPPPLILRNTELLVNENDLLDHVGAPLLPRVENAQEQIDVSSSSTLSCAPKSDPHEDSAFSSPQAAAPDVKSTSVDHRGTRTEQDNADLMVSLSRVRDNEKETLRQANSRSPDDMLSEDSGMPDEEIPEGATTDEGAISPPGEFAETVDKVVKNNNEETFTSRPFHVPVIDVSSVEEVPPALPSSLPPDAVVEKIVSDPDSIYSKQENVSDSAASQVLTIDVADKEEIKDLSPSSPGVPYPVNSARKWVLRSGSDRSSLILQGEANSSVSLTSKSKLDGLENVLTAAALVDVVSKANDLLDALHASSGLELTVLHLRKLADLRGLGIDLKCERDKWVKVTKLDSYSPAGEAGEVCITPGDWLLALDSLWADQVGVARLLSRAATPRKDSVLVLARGDLGLELTDEQASKSKPAPAPRPRSIVQASTTSAMESEDFATKPSKYQEDQASLSSTTTEYTSSTKTSEFYTQGFSDTLSSRSASTSRTSASSPPLSESSTPRSPRVLSAPVETVLATTSTTTASQPGESEASEEENIGGVLKVVMMKGATGVGFCLEGGKGSPKGDLPIIIKRIFKGGPAEKCGQLKVKDEILEVNGVDFRNMRHYEAWNHLKFLDDGEVCITIKRS